MSAPTRFTETTRREFIRRTCAAAGGATLAGPLAAQLRAGTDPGGGQGRPPNILLLMVDQLRYPLWDSSATPLPGIQRLREEGMTFESMYCSATPCTPSRASIFTGLHMEQHGLEINVCDAVPALNPTIPTLGHYFEHAGYRTPYFGKWHLSIASDYDEDVGLKPYGFEDWCCRNPASEEWCCAEGAEADKPCCADSQGWPGAGVEDDPVIADRTVKWLTRNGKAPAPWLLVCALVNPHDIMFYKRIAKLAEGDELPLVTSTLPANFNDDLSTKPTAHSQYQKLWGMLWDMPAGGANAASTDDWLRAMDYYYYVTHKADEQIVTVLNALDALDLYDDTLVLFLSDHGELAGAHRMMGKGPFAYEESVRVPLVARWPGRIPARTTTRALAQTVDLLPTLLDLAGIVPENQYLPGRSLKPVLLENPAAQVNDHVLMAYGMSMAAMVAENSQYGATMPVDYTPAPWQFHAIYDGTYKFVRYFQDGMTGEEFELYDHTGNRLEMDNLARKVASANIRRVMADRLQSAENTEMAPIPAAYFKAPFGPTVTSDPVGNGQILVRFDTQKGVTYQVQSSIDLRLWTDDGPALTGTGIEVEVLLPATDQGRFFRVKRL
jgi:arylsulfatase